MQITNTGKFTVKISAITTSAPNISVAVPAMPYYLNTGTSLTINLSFAPTTAGAVSGSVTVISNAVNSPALLSVTGTGVLPVTTLPLAISTTSLPQGTAQSAYTATLTATGGQAPYMWSLASGMLPPGLTLQPAGSISGTPTTAGSFTFSVSARDAVGASVVKPLSISVVAAATTPVAYGNVGDPYEGATPPAATLISTCQTLAPTASYRLSRALAALTSANVCLQLTGPNTTIDLNGYKITGRITAPATNINGAHIFNGTIECAQFSDTGDNGCVWLYGDNRTATNQVRLHHLSVRNTAPCSRAIHIEWDAPGAYTGTYLLRLSNLNMNAASGPTCSRSFNVSIIGSDYVTAEFDHNDVTCPADSGACQGVVFYGTNNNRAHHNRIELLQNTTAETARGILCDKSDYCEIDENLVIANNNRAFRVRDSQHARIHDNVVQQITCCGASAVHLGDPDAGTNDLDAIIENNAFEVRDGLVLTIRSAFNAWFRNNTISCVGCSGSSNLARVRSGLSTSINLENNPSVTALPSPQIMVESGAAVAVCESGQAAGSGAITTSASCTN